MLQIVEFEEGRKKYGLQNSWTGILLPNKRNSGPVKFWTLRGAERSLRKREKNFSTTMRKISVRLDKGKV